MIVYCVIANVEGETNLSYPTKREALAAAAQFAEEEGGIVQVEKVTIDNTSGRAAICNLINGTSYVSAYEIIATFEWDDERQEMR